MYLINVLLSVRKKKDHLHHDSISAISFFHFSPEIGKAMTRKEKGRGSKEGRVKGTDSDKNNLPVNIWD